MSAKEIKKEKQPPFFTLKRKAAASLICLGIIALWLILWLIFPMEFYSIFFASSIGSNITLILLSSVITIPMNLVFSRLLRSDIRLSYHLTANIIGMLAVVYTYSIFRYTAVYWLVIAAIVHIAACIPIFIKSKPDDKKTILEKKTTKALISVLCTVLSDGLFLILFTVLLNIFRE
ncbi:MAG: hypothetical protein ACI4KF_04905 [Huintestinicola sp.]